MDNTKAERTTTPCGCKGRKSLLHLVSLIIIFVILVSLTLVMRGSLFGVGLDKEGKAAPAPQEQTESDGTLVINTTALCAGVAGYGGPVPVEVYVTGNRIDSVSVLPNSESPEFFASLGDEGLLGYYNGKTLDEAIASRPDAVSGATFSSKAFIANVEAGVRKAIADKGKTVSAGTASKEEKVPVGMVASLVVLLLAAILPFFIKGKWYRIVQEVLNVAVLGFWTGTFIDYAMMMRFLANGIGATLASVVMLVLFIIAFVYPLFGKTAHYCSWVCPYGSLQDLAGRCCKWKLRMSPWLIKLLDNFRMALWTVLLCLLYAGVGTAWIDNEIFTGFIVKTASIAVICTGVAFVLLSLFVPRPFCRFVCPTGTLLRLQVPAARYWVMILLAVSVVVVSVKIALGGDAGVLDKKGDTMENTTINDIMTRSSVRNYSDKAISEATVDTLLRAGMAAPTAANTQPWEFVVITDAGVRERLAEELPYCKMAAKAPLLIAVCGNSERFLEDFPDFWVQDCSAASENILLAAHALGLGAVWTGVYPDKTRVEEVSQALQIPASVVPLNIICIGCPAAPSIPKEKWAPERVHRNKY